MDELLELILQETKQLSRSGSTVDYAKFERLVEMRQTLVDALDGKADVSPEEKKRIRDLLEYDPVILEHMQQIKDEAAAELTRLNGYKKQRAAYTKPNYSDSILFDKRNQ